MHVKEKMLWRKRSVVQEKSEDLKESAGGLRAGTPKDVKRKEIGVGDLMRIEGNPRTDNPSD